MEAWFGLFKSVGVIALMVWNYCDSSTLPMFLIDPISPLTAY
jgi:hypothetical protein